MKRQIMIFIALMIISCGTLADWKWNTRARIWDYYEPAGSVNVEALKVTFYTESEVDALLSGKANVSHNHDTRYYTEAEITALLAAKADTDHTHDVGTTIPFTTVSTATYELTATDVILHVTRTATGTCQITIPSSEIAKSKRRFIVKDAGGNANTFNITIVTEGAETIDGAATAVMATDYESLTLYSDGSNLFII